MNSASYSPVSPRPPAPRRQGYKPQLPRNTGDPRSVDPRDVPMIKGMLQRGDIQSDIAAFFGTNNGRIAEINTGQKFPEIAAHPQEGLPAPGPYLAARTALRAVALIRALHELTGDCLKEIDLDAFSLNGR